MGSLRSMGERFRPCRPSACMYRPSAHYVPSTDLAIFNRKHEVSMVRNFDLYRSHSSGIALKRLRDAEQHS